MTVRLTRQEAAAILKSKAARAVIAPQKRQTAPKLDNYSKQFISFEKKVDLKAKAFLNNLGWGVGGREKMRAMINENLDKPCPYCKEIMVLSTISLDHKQPILRSKRYDKIRKLTDDYKKLNSSENLQMICLRCNRQKREIPHDKYVKLLAFLDQDPDLKQMILKRLSTSGMAYAFSRFKRKS